jgi:cyclophilin family peptidyl-prolyl cis-trans isomerase
VGKAAKRERQKINKSLREEEKARKQSREKTIRVAKTIGLIVIIPVVILVAVIVNKASNPVVYKARITVAIDGVKNLPNKGVIEVSLDNAHSPKSVKHFVGFASNGLYDGLSWHRVVNDFVIQGGDPKGDGTGSLGSSIAAELPENGYKQGDLAWAKGSSEAAGTAGSQFFVITGKTKDGGVTGLNQKQVAADGDTATYQYGFIGHVTKGLNTALAIEKLAPKDNNGDGAPTKKAIIVKIEIFKDGKLMKAGDVIPPTTSSTSTTSTTSTTAATVPTS